jgi:NADH-quinone oxidoreductase subunit A
MGDFEVLSSVISTVILAVVVYNLLNVLTFKDLLRRFGLLKLTRRDFYECGFKPQTQRPVKISIQFLLICVFFLLYDIELVFLFMYVSGYTFTGLYDTLLVILFFMVFLSSLAVDYERHALL